MRQGALLTRAGSDFRAGNAIDMATGAANVEDDARGLQTSELASQADDMDGDGKYDALVFQIDLGPNQTRIVTIAWGDQATILRLRTQYPARTVMKFATRYEGLGWESEDIAWRIYFDKRNAIDIYGKRRPGLYLDLFAAPEFVYQRTIAPEDAPDKAHVFTMDFEKGDPVAIDGERLSPASLLARLNQLGHDNGVGRLDLVEGRFVGMKSRGVYETPGGTILLAAHRGIESITLDRGAAHLKDELMPRYAELIYNGFWFSPEREMLQALIDRSQEFVTGTVNIKLYKGNVMVTGRSSPFSLYSQDLVTFEDDQGAYDQKDASGFIKLNALRLRTLAMRKRKAEKK